MKTELSASTSYSVMNNYWQLVTKGWIHFIWTVNEYCSRGGLCDGIVVNTYSPQKGCMFVGDLEVHAYNYYKYMYAYPFSPAAAMAISHRLQNFST